MIRKKTANSEAYRELKTLIQDTLKAGEMTIPSERTLASTFSVSRMTLRKALARALDENLLHRIGTSYVVSQTPHPTTAHPTSRATLVFAAKGIDIPSNRVWARIASHLSRLCQTTQVNFKLLLLRPDFDTNHQCLDLTQIPDCDAMVIAQDALSAIPIDTWVKKRNVPLITVEMDRPQLPPSTVWDTIGCDHFYVGQHAARYLIEQGCQKPLYIGWELPTPYLPFIKRQQGFLDQLGPKVQVMNIGPVSPTSHMPATDRERQLSQLIPQIISGQYDGIFFQADEHLNFLVNAIGAYGPLPHMVSILGNGDLNDHALPVAYFDHAEKQIADRLFQRLEQILAGKATQVIEQWVQPDLHIPSILEPPSHPHITSAPHTSFQLFEV